MDSRSTKSRSLGLDSELKPHQNVPNSRLKRPGLGERHKSAPSVADERRSHPQPVSDDQGSSVVDDCGTKASSRKGSLSKLSQTTHGGATTPTFELEQHPQLRLVVVGNSKVGKTSFIRNAFELRKSPSQVSSSRVSFARIVYRIQMVELELDDIEIEEGCHISWPEYVNDLPFVSPDGVICVYDSTDSNSIDGVPQFLSALSNLDTPVQLVAAKSDELPHELNTQFLEKVQRVFPHVLIAEASNKLAESSKKCMLAILKSVLSSRSGSGTGTELRPSSSTQAELSQQHDESAASIEYHSAFALNYKARGVSSRPESSGTYSNADDTDDDDQDDDERSGESSDEDTSAQRSKSLTRLQTVDLDRRTGPLGPQTPISETEPIEDQSMDRATPQTPESYNNSNMIRPGTSETADSRIHQTFFHLDDESPETSPVEPPIDASMISDMRVEGGMTFSELVDRLLQLPRSKIDSKFAPAFLCLYRTFATPLRLLIAIINRFVKIDNSDVQQLIKVAELLRYLQVMAQWTASYPGDFTEQALRELATTFVHGLEGNKNLAPAAKEIGNNLKLHVLDDDRYWAYSESKKKRNIQSGDCDAESNSEDDGPSVQPSPRHSGTASTASSVLKSSMASSQSATNIVALENAREQARKLKTIPYISLSKNQWHLFMETPTEELARELTRVDWTMYSAIRPRDFVRHVTIPRERNKSDNIGAMIKHFNHLALFVAGMILLRDKPKHRAKALEKFMDLAWKVRQLNNYNSLAALVAGITSHEVIRLGQTHELVPTDVKKKFLRLTVLMSSAKSYATYRMAWENSFAERIPFISTLLRDLTLAANANPTFVGSYINWKKFEIMGDTIISIQRSQEQGYSFPEKSQRLQEITKMVLETKVINDAEDSADPHSELYNRSVQVEPQTGGNESKKKFDWLRR